MSLEPFDAVVLTDIFRYKKIDWGFARSNVVVSASYGINIGPHSGRMEWTHPAKTTEELDEFIEWLSKRFHVSIASDRIHPSYTRSRTNRAKHKREFFDQRDRRFIVKDKRSDRGSTTVEVQTFVPHEHRNPKGEMERVKGGTVLVWRCGGCRRKLTKKDQVSLGVLAT